MQNRAALTLLLLLPAVASAQEIDQARSALVRISGERGGTPVQGSGFVVAIERDKATVVTAAHVVEGVERLTVSFAAESSEIFPAAGPVRMDAGSRHGLAVFQVRGVPQGVTALGFDTANRPALGTALFLWGYPQRALTPRTTQRVLGDRSGPLLLIDQDVGEGFSGGPVLLNGRVAGVVTDTDDQTTYAVTAVIAREVLDGWGVRLGGASAQRADAPGTPPPARPTEVAPCVPGEERTENGMVFVRLCAGTFTLGSAADDLRADSDERPAHEVTLSAFWIGKTEVTNEQYRRFRPDQQWEARLPVTNVSWSEAKAACEHFGGRLPTEAEWEYAARAGSRAAWSFGDDEQRLGEYAWYQANAGSKPQPVGMKKPNLWGLHDMHGNVWEWVADWDGPYNSAAQRDPTGPTTGASRVLRGGSFIQPPTYLRSAYRGRFLPEVRDRNFGFRCVWASPSPALSIGLCPFMPLLSRPAARIEFFCPADDNLTKALSAS